MLNINRANTNSLWSSVLVECLSRCGLQHVVISPGSRSTPLTMAFAGHKNVKAVPVLDERSAGFFALGIAKQTHRPVALVCTSGTAAVNYFPAVVEASEARIPLLVLTADRPPELRDCGAGQTIDQIGLYGGYPLYQEELPLPNCTQETLMDLKNRLINAYRNSLRGPVHLNCPFRDPLPPIEDHSTDSSPEISENYFSDVVPPFRDTFNVSEQIQITTNRGIIICGTEAPLDPEAYCKSIAALSNASGWPVLADGLSPVRNFCELQNRLVTTYDFILRNESLSQSLKPECVIALGPLPTSKNLRQWLTDADAKMYHIHQMGKNLDPTGTCVKVLEIPVDAVAESFRFEPQIDPDYCEKWLGAQSTALKELEDKFSKINVHPFEGKVAWKLPTLLPEGTPVFVASSMPVRDVEYFWTPNDKRIQVYASRGVNGIDGTLSTALGVAHENKPSVLLTGDLAFLHDSNGMLIRPKLKGHLTVLLINNKGGGIFNHLPIAHFDPPFEEFFATPQEVDFKKFVESAGCEYLKLKHLNELSDLLAKLPDSGIRVIEIQTDRRQDTEYRKRLLKSISQSLI